MQNKRLLILLVFVAIFLIGAYVIMMNGRPVNDIAPEAQAVSDQPVVTPTEPAAGYAMAQVATHSTPESCWAVIGGDVYDLTSWVSRHPGGPGPIKGLCGIDATPRFEAKHGGSAAAKAALVLLKIGALVE